MLTLSMIIGTLSALCVTFHLYTEDTLSYDTYILAITKKDT
jgi:hypothetical protein